MLPAMPTSQFLLASLNILLAMLAGVATAYQPGINSRFAEAAGQRIHGAIANFAIGLLAVVVVSLFLRAGVPDHQKLAQGPWWMWLGGLCGAFFVTLAIVLVPKMGAANYLAAMIAGQLLASAVIDHFGHMGLPVHALTPGRAMGLGLIAIGVVCVRWL